MLVVEDLHGRVEAQPDPEALLAARGIPGDDAEFLSGLEPGSQPLDVEALAPRKPQTHPGLSRHELEGQHSEARQIRTMNDIRVVVFLTEMQGGKVKVNLRARPGFDVGALARDFGGGGHRQASGCTVDGAMPKVEKRVLKEIFARLGR